MNFTPIELGASLIFAIAVLHTFCTSYFESLAKNSPRHAGLWHLLGEVEIVFGFWAAALIIYICLVSNLNAAKSYLNSRNFTEPLFVFAIMIVAGSKPILHFSTQLLHAVAKSLKGLLGIRSASILYFLTLGLTPLLGSLITEPAAMTLAAFLLRDLVYRHQCSKALLFGTLGVLFVNISIGGTLTNFAAPPVLMVASTWEWSSVFMFNHFGIESCIAIFINALVATLLFHRQLIEPRELNQHAIIKLAIQRQRWIDQAQSVNLFFVYVKNKTVLSFKVCLRSPAGNQIAYRFNVYGHFRTNINFFIPGNILI